MYVIHELFIRDSTWSSVSGVLTLSVEVLGREQRRYPLHNISHYPKILSEVSSHSDIPSNLDPQELGSGYLPEVSQVVQDLDTLFMKNLYMLQ